jgi:hypothetical protein
MFSDGLPLGSLFLDLVGGSACTYFLALLTATTTILFWGFSSPFILMLFLSLYYFISSFRLVRLSYNSSGRGSKLVFLEAKKSYLAVGPCSVLTLILVAVVPTLELLLAVLLIIYP